MAADTAVKTPSAADADAVFYSYHYMDALLPAYWA